MGRTVGVEVIRKGQKRSLQVKVGKLEEEKEPVVLAQEGPELGMTAKEITPELARSLGLSETSGLVVVQVEDNTPAAEAGLRPGDIILEVEQVPVKDLEQFNQKMAPFEPGDTVLFLIKRRESTLYVTLNIWE